MESVKKEASIEAVIITRTFNASRERVFRAWTEVEQFKQWFGPEGVVVSVAEIDLRVGGAFRVEMLTSEGKTVAHSGEYLEITSPSRLVYSWVLDGQGCGGSEGQYADTVVTVEFEEYEGATKIRLTHEGLPSEQARKGHIWGHTSSLEKLADYLG